LAVEYVKSGWITIVYDVFVGSVKTLVVANDMGLDAVGVDNDQSQCNRALQLTL
jgi:DNA modification methylase